MASLIRIVKRRFGLIWQKHRARVGPAAFFDPLGTSQFELLKILGLRPDSYVLDVGCGALSAAKHLIPYLEPRHYFAIEPQQWLIDAGLRHEVSARTAREKQPSFNNNDQFDLSLYGQQFDFLLAHSIFSHTSQAQMRKALSETKKVLRPGGIFAVSYVSGDSNYEGDVWVAPGVTIFTPAKMEELAAEAGLAVAPTKWPHFPKPMVAQTWLVVFHPQNAARATELVAAVNQRAATYRIIPDVEGPAWYRERARRRAQSQFASPR